MLRISWTKEAYAFPPSEDVVFGFDTETTGLNIIEDKPFLIQFGAVNLKTLKGWVSTTRNVDSAEVKTKMMDYAKQCLYTTAHNIKFDVNMLINVGQKDFPNNLLDTQFLIRYAHDAIQTDKGGPPLNLIQYAKRYIDKNADRATKKLQKAQQEKAKTFPKLPKQIETKLADMLIDVEDLTDQELEIYTEWKTNLPITLQAKVKGKITPKMVQYNEINQTVLDEYAVDDVIYLLEIVVSLLPYVKQRNQMDTIKLEMELIAPFLEMERTGFQIDTEYISHAKKVMKEFIKNQRNIVTTVLGENITVSQHAKLKEILNTKFHMNITSTDEKTLTDLEKKTKEGEPIKKALRAINLLRTAEKWYATYILRFENKDKIYTQINQVGTVSGRISSDMQQMPKKKFEHANFEPRRSITCPKGKMIVFYDYSQIELRIQALYTLLLGHPDINMLRAYMPYGLKGDEKANWTPTDIHGKTTEHATGLTPDHPDFKEQRSKIGKVVNFAKNFGAQRGQIKLMFPDYPDDKIDKIDQAYYSAFPGIKQYHTYCERRAMEHAYTSNLFGTRYYNVPGHNLKNYLVQGSAAIMLKKKILEVHEYLKTEAPEARLMMQIHDEILVLWPEDTPKDKILKVKEIMEDWPSIQVPIVADAEYTKTSWADKEDYVF